MSFAWRNNVYTLGTRAGNNLQVVVLREIDSVLCEEHSIFISNDIKHDVLFVELCNDTMHTYYDEFNVDIDLNIDGCASQLKWIHAI